MKRRLGKIYSPRFAISETMSDGAGFVASPAARIAPTEVPHMA